MTPFALLLRLCGLSQREAALFLNVSGSAVDKMSRGVRKVPPGIMSDLRNLHQTQRRAADDHIRTIGEGGGNMIKLGLASDDHEAQSLGWPCVGAQAGAYALVIAATQIPVEIVPRGSTLATALAADQLEGGLKISN